LLILLANTSEPLYLVNRSGNCTSSAGAAGYLDKAIDLCLTAGFRKILVRGDTDFSQTGELDRWDDKNVKFIFGINAMCNLENIAKHNLANRLNQPPGRNGEILCEKNRQLHRIKA